MQKDFNPLIYAGMLGFRGVELVWHPILFLLAAYFLVSLFISPVMSYDTGIGFLALRSMLQGGSFNSIVTPDPANIADDSTSFLTWYSPGQYLAPSLFIWLGFNYETAISLTILAASIAGIFGWFKVADAFGAPRELNVFFVMCLGIFYYIPEYFQVYSGEILLFAVAPWSLYSLWYGAKASPAICFVIALATGALLFFAKLTGLVVFASTVSAISFVEILQKRRITGAIVALWAAAATGALCFLVFWHSRGDVPADGDSKLAITWANIWFPVAAASLSGVSGIQVLNWFSHTLTSPGSHQLLVKAVALLSLAAVAAIGWSFRKQMPSHLRVRSRVIIVVAIVIVLLGFIVPKFVGEVGNYRGPHFVRDVMLSIIGCLSLWLASWMWKQLRSTKYRTMSVMFLTIVFIYICLMILMFSAGSAISLEERHLRYAGILFFLLFLTALEQQGAVRARYIKVLIVGFFGGFGLLSYVSNARELTQGRYYDPLDFSLPHRMPLGVLEYLRSEQVAHKWRRPVALIPQEAALELPQFRVIGLDARWDQNCGWRGRSEKLFVVIPEEVPDSRSAALLKCFQDYDQSKWSRLQIKGMTVYAQ